MSFLVDLITAGEETLINRIITYAGEMGYARYTPADPLVWRKAVRGLSSGIVAALGRSTQVPELSPDMDYLHDTITCFGIDQARRHRFRGVTLERFLGLMKYFRQSYHDLVDEAGSDAAESRWAALYIDRYFDRIEIGFVSEWERNAAELGQKHEKLLLARNSDLRAANKSLQREVAERQRAEEQVMRLNADLERRVARRTAQLQRLTDQNTHKLKELAILNRFSSINLSSFRLNRLTYLILSTLTSSEQKFFDRAMLFMVNERSQTLQGMLGVERDDASPLLAAEAEGGGSGVTEEDVKAHQDSPLSRRVRSCRLEMGSIVGGVARAVTEKKVFKVNGGGEGGVNRELEEFFGNSPFAVMPIKEKGRVFCIVLVDNSLTGREIGRDDLRFLRLFANSAGVAIENLMLFTRLEEASRRLNEAQEQLMHGERLATIGEMSAGIAHELKGPLVSIGGFARRLARSMREGSSEAQYVATIIEEGGRLENMLADILAFSKKTTICYERCSIAEVIDGALAIVAHAVERSQVTLIKAYPRKQIYLYGDCQQLKQVFINLIHNALEVMPCGGELRVGVAAALLGGEKALIVRVADTGSGIPVAMLHNIFNPFVTTKKSGTGLGLPIANRIVANHGGKMRVRNRGGGGAEFAVILPCRE